MSNKTQLHLKTLFFDSSLSTNTRFNSQSFVKTKRCPTESKNFAPLSDKKQIRSHSNPKRHSTQLLASKNNSDFMAKFSQLSINRQSMRDFAKKQFFKRSGGFPKRQPILRNTNAFKYFVNSTINRPQQTEPNFLDEFYTKIRQAIADIPPYVPLSNQARKKSITEPSLEPSRPSRVQKFKKTSNSSLKPQTEKARNAGLEPWDTFNAEENAISIADL